MVARHIQHFSRAEVDCLVSVGGRGGSSDSDSGYVDGCSDISAVEWLTISGSEAVGEDMSGSRPGRKGSENAHSG